VRLKIMCFKITLLHHADARANKGVARACTK